MIKIWRKIYVIEGNFNLGFLFEEFTSNKKVATASILQNVSACRPRRKGI